MFADNLLLLGVVGWVAAALMVVTYYTFFMEQITLSDLDDQEWDHQPELDDEILSLTAAMYPYHEFMHYIGPFPTSQPQEGK